MEKKNILIRTIGGKDNSHNIGLGHIYRMINLVEELKPIKPYFLIEDYGNVKKILKDKKMQNIICLKKKISLKEDIEETKNLIQKKKIDLIIIDKYPINANYIKEIKKKCKTVVIADLKNISYNGDLLINGFIGYDNKIIKNSNNVKCLLGPKYQILNKKFITKEKIVKKNDLVITLGGSNNNKLIEIISDLHRKMNNKLKIKMILGPSYIESKKFKNQKNLKIIKKTDDMKKEILTSKYGICGGGITTYEFASMNIPFGIISIAKHQLQTAKEWEKYEVDNLGSIDKISRTKITQILDKLGTKGKIVKPTYKVDGKGGIRVSKEIKKLLSHN